MAYNENKNLKMYYSISEVAEMFGIAETALRYWETEFPQIAPKRVGRGVRQFTQEDIEKVRAVYNLVKVRGLKISAARNILRRNAEGTQQNVALLESLNLIRSELAELRKELGDFS